MDEECYSKLRGELEAGRITVSSISQQTTREGEEAILAMIEKVIERDLTYEEATRKEFAELLAFQQDRVIQLLSEQSGKSADEWRSHLMERLYFSKFELEDFRCFGDIQKIKFAIPNNKLKGSGITYIVGENNSGKTSILEAMQMNEKPYRNNKLRNSDVKSNRTSFKLFAKDIGVVRHLTQVRPGSFVLIDKMSNNEMPGLSEDYQPLFISARRFWSPRVQNSDNLENVGHSNMSGNEKLRQTADDYLLSSQIADLFYAIETCEAKYSEFTGLIRQVFPDFIAFTVVNEDSTNVTYKTSDGISHRADFLGDGVASVMRLFAQIVSNACRAIVIDEPELSLHPLSQKRLVAVLAERSMQQQIIISTHSPYMVEWEYIKNGAKLNRVSKKEARKSKIFTLGDYDEYSNLVQAGSWNQPYHFDAVAKEIFFNDNLLFTEGQEDVGLLRRTESLDSDINVFGYGVRGWEHFRFSLKLANDLGVNKAAAILDGGEKGTGTKESLENDFPDYLIVQLEREDIRDKDGYCPLNKQGEPDLQRLKEAKEGYFTSAGKLKPKEDLGDFLEKIYLVNNYFASS